VRGRKIWWAKYEPPSNPIKLDQRGSRNELIMGLDENGFFEQSRKTTTENCSAQ
jgi:hypothetical protein